MSAWADTIGPQCAAVQKETLTPGNFNKKEKILLRTSLPPSSDHLLGSRAWAVKSSSLSVKGDTLGTGDYYFLNAAGR